MRSIRRISFRSFRSFLLALIGLATISGFSGNTQALEPLCGYSRVASVEPKSAITTIDGQVSTSYGLGNNKWQSVTIDLKCRRTISGLRRYMVRIRLAQFASRNNQGESWSYSTDGVRWIQILGSSTFGWNSYINYVPHAWHSVDYGWSRWLRTKRPVTARYIRYSWDGNNDSVGEIEIDARTVSSSRAAINRTSVWNVIDSSPRSGLYTGYQNWQSVTIDLGRLIRLSRLRRHMAGIFSSRGIQGESWATSTDGASFQNLVASDVTGWEGYVNYLPHAWHSLPYGWSAWLNLEAPRLVRFIRFSWDGNSDSVNEVEFQQVPPGTDPNYDFAFGDPAFAASLSVPNYSNTSQPPSLSQIRADLNVGFTGFYLGQLDGSNGLRSHVTATLLQSNTGEVRGILTIDQGGYAGIALRGGIFCSEKRIPIGTRVAIRLTPWVHDGRFSGQYTLLPGDTERFVSGSTSRPISGFGISGTAQINIYAVLHTTDHVRVDLPGNSHLIAQVQVETPCDDGPPLNLLLIRDDQMLLRTVGL